MAVSKAKSVKAKLAEKAAADRAAKRRASRTRKTKAAAEQPVHLVVPSESSKEMLQLTIAKLQLELQIANTRNGVPTPRQQERVPLHKVSAIRRVGNGCTYTATQHGFAWTPDDEQIIARFIQQGNTDLVALGATIGRTPFAVFARLVKLALINERNCYQIWGSVVQQGYTHG